MFAALRKVLAQWFGQPAQTTIPEPVEENQAIPRSTVESGQIPLPPEHAEDIHAHPVAYDENLLVRARTQWQFGDWESLANIHRDTLQHHPDRAKLALLAAAGRLQTGNNNEAKQFIRLAQDWGISKKLISQILTAGVHNSLGRAAALGNQPQRALQHFDNAISIGTPGNDVKLLTQARTGEQLNQLRALEIKQLIKGDENLSTDNYFIKAGYKSRTEYVHYDDLEEEDQWQLEVYLRAYGLMKRNEWKTVADIGCGSAYKLIKYLGEFETVGYELPANVEKLMERYPERDWRISDLTKKEDIKADLIICSDVIEHLVDPDALMRYLAKQNFELLILSTPERDICRGANDFGPPQNPAHQREWNFDEFRRYVSRFFQIKEHVITNNEQGTQMVICHKKISGPNKPP